MSRKIKLWIETGMHGADYEDFIDLPDGWDGWTQEDRDKFLDDEANQFLANYISCGASVVELDAKDESQRRKPGTRLGVM